MTEKTLIISLKDREIADDSYFKIEVDPDQIYDKPTLNCPYYFRIITKIPYKLDTTMGSLVSDNKGLTGVAAYEEHIYKFQTESSFSYPPTGKVQIDWVGKRTNKTPVIDGLTLRYPSEVFGISFVSYEFNFDKWHIFDVRIPAKVLIVARDLENNILGDLTLEFSAFTGDSAKEDLECDSVKVESSLSNPIVYLYVYGKKPVSISANTGEQIFYMYSLDAQGQGIKETKTEDISFSDGVANVSYAIINKPKILGWTTPNIPNNATIDWINVTTQVECNLFSNNPEKYSDVSGQIEYQTKKYPYYTNIPESWSSDKMTVTLSFDGCADQEVEIDLTGTDPEQLVDMTVHFIQNNCNGDAIPSVTYRLYVDPENPISGVSDTEGRVTFTGLVLGAEIPIQFEKAEYKNSWEDDLCNDTLVVS